MKTLKQLVAQDLEIFFNLEEFGELHKVEGVETCIVLDEDALEKKKNGASFDIAESTILFFAKTQDLPKRKGPESLLNFDGKECIVVEWNEDHGISEVVLRQNRTS